MYTYIHENEYVLTNPRVKLMIDMGAVMIMIMSALTPSTNLRGT